MSMLQLCRLIAVITEELNEVEQSFVEFVFVGSGCVGGAVALSVVQLLFIKPPICDQLHLSVLQVCARWCVFHCSFDSTYRTHSAVVMGTACRLKHFLAADLCCNLLTSLSLLLRAWSHKRYHPVDSLCQVWADPPDVALSCWNFPPVLFSACVAVLLGLSWLKDTM